MPTHPSTPLERITRLLNEGVSFLAIHPGSPGIDVTFDIVGLLEAAREKAEPQLSDSSAHQGHGLPVPLGR